MANAIDYLDWRGDVPLSLDGFNEVDGLIICKLTSLDFTGIVPEDGELGFADALGEYFKRHGEEDRRLGVLLPAGTVTMAKKLLASRRFAGLVISNYINRVDGANAEQFCALTARLPDGTRYAAFRGTDDTIAAWREDFNMSAQDAVPAQLDAAAYLTRLGWEYDGAVRVGGHSKGGNLAVYAAMSAPEELQERISDVYNYDGPGFRFSVAAEAGFMRVRDKIRMFVPQHSMVGVLLANDCPYSIVESSASGVSAHNGFTWQVYGRRFVRRDRFFGAQPRLCRGHKLLGGQDGPPAPPGADKRRLRRAGGHGRAHAHRPHRAARAQGPLRRARPAGRRGRARRVHREHGAARPLLFVQRPARAARDRPLPQEKRKGPPRPRKAIKKHLTLISTQIRVRCLYS